MRILLTTDVIHAGGAETFVLRLGQALAERGHEVVIFPLYAHRVDAALVNTLAPSVRLVTKRIPFFRAVQVFDGLLRRLRISVSLLNQLLALRMASVIDSENIDVVHSHLFTADRVAVKAAGKTGIPVVATIHGDYARYYRLSQEGRLSRIPDFQKKMAAVLARMAAVVCISEAQLHFFRERAGLFSKTLFIRKIYNGFALPEAASAYARQALQIPEDAFVFVMVARGIPEKGWEEAIKAFNKLEQKNSYLLLIGDSSYVQELKQRYSSARVRFLGKQAQPFHWVRLCDVGLFCSKIRTEALPSVVIEYLAAGLPVIATSVGETPLMLQGSSGPAGFLVNPDKATLTGALTKAMARFQNNSTEYRAMQAQTGSAYRKFEMNGCVRMYEQVYAGAANASRKESALLSL